jgi:hypothetical protein
MRKRMSVTHFSAQQLAVLGICGFIYMASAVPLLVAGGVAGIVLVSMGTAFLVVLALIWRRKPRELTREERQKIWLIQGMSSRATQARGGRTPPIGELEVQTFDLREMGELSEWLEKARNEVIWAEIEDGEIDILFHRYRTRKTALHVRLIEDPSMPMENPLSNLFSRRYLNFYQTRFQTTYLPARLKREAWEKARDILFRMSFIVRDHHAYVPQDLREDVRMYYEKHLYLYKEEGGE